MEASDAAAVAQVLAGDQDAFRVLVDRHSRNVFRLAYRMTGSEQDAEDVVQETFLRAYRKLGQFESRANFGTWLYRVTVNCALDYLRLRERRDKGIQAAPASSSDGQETADAALTAPTGEPSPERVVLGAELGRKLASALAELSPHERTAFVLRHFEGMSIEEIARILGLRQGATKNTVFRAVKKLRLALEPLVGLST
jgi:RNA polymerase sigma-70 factor (ECF subfamily)